MGVVVGQPVHLPGAEELPAHRGDLGIDHGQLARRLLEHDLAHVRRVHRHPAEALQEDLGAAVLGLGDVSALAQALVAEARVGDADAVDVARRQPGRAREADEEGVEVGALAREVAGLQHAADVADAAAAHLGLAEGVVHDPVVDRARLVLVALRPLDDVARGVAHDAVGGQQRGGAQVEHALGARQPLGFCAGLGEVGGAVAGGEAAEDLELGLGDARRPLGIDHLRAGAIAHALHEVGVALPEAAHRALPGGLVHRRQRHPHAQRAVAGQRFDAARQLEAAPAGLRGGREGGRFGERGGGGERRGDGGRGGLPCACERRQREAGREAAGAQEVAAVHEFSR